MKFHFAPKALVVVHDVYNQVLNLPESREYTLMVEISAVGNWIGERLK